MLEQQLKVINTASPTLGFQALHTKQFRQNNIELEMCVSIVLVTKN